MGSVPKQFTLTTVILILIMTVSYGELLPSEPSEVGFVRARVTQTWTVSTNTTYPPDTRIILTVYPLSNTLSQHVLNTTSNYPYKESLDDFGNVVYTFNITPLENSTNVTVRLVSDVVINYSVYKIYRDPSLYYLGSQPCVSNGTCFTKPGSELYRVADDIRGNGLISTLVNYSNFVYSRMTYVSNHDPPVNASQVYERGYGTCRDYAVLLMALLNAEGLRNRMVIGYVYSEDRWMPHAWVEVYDKESGMWIPVDPTTNEVLYLSAYHIRIAHQPEPDSLADTVIVKTDTPMNESFNTSFHVDVFEVKNFDIRPEVNLSLVRPNTLYLTVRNGQSSVVPLSIQVVLPLDTKWSKRRIVLLEPYSTFYDNASIPIDGSVYGIISYKIICTGLSKEGVLVLRASRNRPNYLPVLTYGVIVLVLGSLIYYTFTRRTS